jgi:hypothetical protein
MRKQGALQLITGLNAQVNPIRADAAMILFCIFVTRGIRIWMVGDEVELAVRYEIQ